MNAKPGYSITTTSPKARAVPEDWSVLHPDQGGSKAAIRAVPSVNPTTIHDLRDLLEGDETPEQALQEVHASTPDEDGVYQLGMPAPAPAPQEHHLHRTAEGGATYSLEFSTVCPHCHNRINTVRVSRLEGSNQVRVAGLFDSIAPDSVECLRRFVESAVGVDAYVRFLGETYYG